MRPLEKQQRIRLLNCLLAAAGGICLGIIWVFGYVTDRCILSGAQLIVVFTLFNAMSLGFILSILSGLNLRFRDPSLSLAQMYFAQTWSFASLLIVPELSLYIYPLILIILVFGIFRVDAKAFSRFSQIGLSGVLLAEILNGYWYQYTIAASLDSALGLMVMLFCFVGMRQLCETIIQLRNSLRTKNQALNQALEAKSLFLANMSHELRTPMNGVIGMLVLAQKEQPLTSSLKEKLDIAETSANTLLGIINDILDYSKIEAGKLSLAPAEFNLWHTLEEQANTFRYQLRDKKLSLYLDIGPNVPHFIYLDKIRFIQIINNLMSNAVKFTEEGCVKLAVEWNDKERTLEIEVRDTGIGIAAEHKEKVFSKFTQADESMTRKFGGTGLGLSITKQLCELMEGKIELDSQEGTFTQFTVRLPTSQAKYDLASTFDLSEITPQHLLVINGDDIISHILKRTLPMFGVSFTFVQYPNIEPNIESNLETLEKIIEDQTPALIENGVTLQILLAQDHRYQIIRWKDFSSQHVIPTDHIRDLELISPNQIYALLTHPQILSQPEIEKPFKEKKRYSHNLLVVDDNPTNLELAGMILEDLGFGFDLVDSGEEAVKQFTQKTSTIDLILMDCQMPTMDGFEATQLIRQYEKKHNLRPTPIFALTANVLNADKEHCLKSGMDDFIPKPIDVDFLEDKIHMHMKINSTNSEMYELDDNEFWDKETFLSKLRFKHDRAKRIIDVFLENIDERFNALETSVIEGEFEEAGRLAHGLKGSSLNLYLMKLADCVKKIETAADNFDVETLKELIPECKIYLCESVRVLQDYQQAKALG